MRKQSNAALLKTKFFIVQIFTVEQKLKRPSHPSAESGNEPFRFFVQQKRRGILNPRLPLPHLSCLRTRGAGSCPCSPLPPWCSGSAIPSQPLRRLPASNSPSPLEEWSLPPEEGDDELVNKGGGSLYCKRSRDATCRGEGFFLTTCFNQPKQLH